MQDLESIVVETGAGPVGAVIWLHGLGADGHDFEPIVAELQLPPSMPLRFVFPHAPVRPVTVNGGMEMRAWYDIVSLDKEGRADDKGIRESSVMLDDLITAQESQGIPSEQIVLAGFSQGGAIAIHNTLTSSKHFKGLMALSTYIALSEAAKSHAGDDSEFPVFVAHGSFDQMLPCELGRGSADTLSQLGYVVEWHEYPMAHGVCPQEIDDISQWLQSIYTT